MIAVVYSLFAGTIVFLAYMVMKLLGILVFALLLYFTPILFLLAVFACTVVYFRKRLMRKAVSLRRARQ